MADLHFIVYKWSIVDSYWLPLASNQWLAANVNG